MSEGIIFPDPCWIIWDIDDPHMFVGAYQPDLNVYAIHVFSTEKNAHTYMANMEPDKKYVVKEYSWHDLLETYGSKCSYVSIDDINHSTFNPVPLFIN